MKPEPITRKEMYLNAIAEKDKSGAPDNPITREEKYLDAILKSGNGSGGMTEEEANERYAAKDHTVITGSFSMGRKEDRRRPGLNSFAAGSEVSALGDFSHAEGNSTTASGNNSHAEGQGTNTYGEGAHAEGIETTAGGDAAHAEGQSTNASGLISHAEGHFTTASGDFSHSEGQNSAAEGFCSHAEGYGTNASSSCQHVQGHYNVPDMEGRYAHIVGGGSEMDLRNIHTLDWEGNAMYAGTVSAADPTEPEHLATKAYVDGTAMSRVQYTDTDPGDGGALETGVLLVVYE